MQRKFVLFCYGLCYYASGYLLLWLLFDLFRERSFFILRFGLAFFSPSIHHIDSKGLILSNETMGSSWTESLSLMIGCLIWTTVWRYSCSGSSMVAKVTWGFLARNGIAYQWLGAHYFIFSTHISQYFSIRRAPSTSNKASWVATLPQCAQNFVLPLCSEKGLNDINLFCTWFSSPQSQQVQLLQYYPPLIRNVHIYTLAWCKED